MLSGYPGVAQLGSEPSAAGGRASEASEWPRSARHEPAPPGDVTAGHRNRKGACFGSWNTKTVRLPKMLHTPLLLRETPQIPPLKVP